MKTYTIQNNSMHSSFVSYNEERDYLAHYQIKGAKHGVRRYQNEDGSLTPLGREHYGIGPARGSKEAMKNKEKAEKKAKRQEKKNSKKQLSADQQKQKLREEIVQNPKKIVKYKDAFSRKEMESIISDIEWNRKLSDIKHSQFTRTSNRVKDLADALGNVSSLMNNSINTVNNAKKIMNAFQAAKNNSKKS